MHYFSSENMIFFWSALSPAKTSAHIKLEINSFSVSIPHVFFRLLGITLTSLNRAEVMNPPLDDLGQTEEQT